MDTDAIRATGATSLDDLLQRLPPVYIDRSARINSGGDGRAGVGLRNLGSARTLVLVNGRRQVLGDIDGGVDLNAIPIAAVERIDVYSGSAAATFGEAAVAGVIDIRLVSGFAGARASTQWGEYTEGDGRRQAHDFVLGMHGERGNVTIVAGYVKEDPIWAGDRDISAVPTFGLPAINTTFAGASGVGERGRVIGTPGFTTANGGGILIPGRPGTSPDDFRPFNALTDGYNYAPGNYLLTPQERVSLFMDGRHQVLDGVEFYTHASFNERGSEQVQAAFPLGIGLFSGGAFNALRMSASSVYNPFGADVSFTRRLVETGGRRYTQDVDDYQFVGGFQGDVVLGTRSFGWDVGYQYGKRERSDQNFGFQFSTTLGRAIGPSFIDAQGVPTCGTPLLPIAGCVPFNPFAPAGDISQAMLDYIGYVEQANRGSDLSSYWARVTGDLFELVENRPVAFAAGYDYRRESAFDQPDALTNAGLTTGVVRAGTRGGYSVDEFHLALTAPLLADLPFVHLLEASAAGRHSDYSTFGSTTNLSASLAWQPIEDLTLRGSWAEGFRAPSVFELFQDSYFTFPGLNDPCSYEQLAVLPPEVRQRCMDAGVPFDYYQVGFQRSVLGGNPRLAPELADTRGLGLSVSPRWIDGLDISLDWQRIAIDEAIAPQSAQFILNACFLNPDPAVRSTFCPSVIRHPSGAIRDVIGGAFNSLRLRHEHWDLAVAYRIDTGLGAFEIDWLGSYLAAASEYRPLASGGWLQTERAGRELGDEAYPRLRSTLGLSWALGDFGLDWRARYHHHTREACPYGRLIVSGVPSSIGFQPCSNADDSSSSFASGYNRLGSTTMHDVRGTWNTPWQGQLGVGISNVFAKDPPVSYQSFAHSYNVRQFQPPGRAWFVQYRQQW